MINLQDLTPAMITRAYLGKPGCMCGCRGKYYVTASNKAPKSYSVANTAMVTKILRMIQANEDLLETNGSWYAAQVGGKEYVVYFEE